MKQTIIAILTILLSLLSPAIEESPEVVPLLSSGDTDVINLVASGDVTSGDDVIVGDALTVGGLSTFTGDATGGNVLATGEIDVGTFLNFSIAATVVATDSATGFTPLGTYQPLSAVAAVGTLVTTTGFTAGDLVILHNVGDNTITISDSVPMALSSDAALGDNDTLTIVFSGTGWIEIAEGAN